MRMVGGQGVVDEGGGAAQRLPSMVRIKPAGPTLSAWRAGVVAATPTVVRRVHGPRGARVRAPSFKDAAVAARVVAAATQHGTGRDSCFARLLQLANIMAAACNTAASNWDNILALRDGPFTVRELLRCRAEKFITRGAPALSLWFMPDTLRGSPILMGLLRIFWSNLTRVAVPHFPRPLRATSCPPAPT